MIKRDGAQPVISSRFASSFRRRLARWQPSYRPTNRKEPARRGLRPGLVGWLAVLLIPLLCATAKDTQAACADLPSPKVNWQRCSLDGATLAAVDLSYARLRGASFIRSNLEKSNLTGANAPGARFVNARMVGIQAENARFYDADLTKADLRNANLKNADFRRARLFRANFSGADLTAARFAEADLDGTIFAGALWVDGQRVCKENSVGRCL